MSPFGSEQPQEDPEMGGMGEESEMPEGAYEICLTVLPDGQMSISVEEAGEEGTPEPVGSLKEAIEKIIQLIQEKDQKGSEEEDGFNAAFKGDKNAEGKPMAQTGPGRFG